MTSAPPGTDDTAALSRAVDEDPGDDPAARWQALWLLSRAAGRNGDYQRERARLLELIELGDLLQAADLRARSHARYAAACAHWATYGGRSRRPWRRCRSRAPATSRWPTSWPPSWC
ncbi:hypothetical protein [Streptomyces sp. enrichment culture]|uniref:hypothetical protein n=1 Tax=Streptomyces sp. enrichment culture TaxID=1795815 RepID=UPI003F57E2FC